MPILAFQSRLDTLPLELLELIAFELTCLTPLGPPSALLTLLLTCKSINNALSRSMVLYSRIFHFKFDTSAVQRRAFNPTPAQYFDQLVLYCTQLQKLRSQVRADDCDDVLFSAFLMMLENDGRNAAQLEHAGLDSYLDVFVRSRLWDGRASAHGWPTDNTANACALWLVWMTTSEKKLKAESPARRNQMIQLVLPFVLLPYRYASAFAPLNHFVLPVQASVDIQPHSILTAHGRYPIYLDPDRVWSQVHYASRPTMIPPLLTTAAKLVYFSRRETEPFGIPSHLPLDRDQAIRMGRTQVGPTQADIQEVNAHLNEQLPQQRLPEWDLERGSSGSDRLSKRWDCDWWRVRKCMDAFRENDRRLGPTYEPGTFTGLWQGRMLIPSEHHFTALLTTRDYPPSFNENLLQTTTFPLFMRIHEHHSRAPNQPAPPCDDVVSGYFPPKTRIAGLNSRSVVVRVGDGDESYEYSTHGSPGGPSHDSDSCPSCVAREDLLRQQRSRATAAAAEKIFSRLGMGLTSDDGEDDLEEQEREPSCDGIQDIIFTGETDLHHGQAWNHFEFYGRVRLWDGMIGLLRVSTDPRRGTLLFYGYLVGAHKFVGNWRSAHQDTNVPAYESAFMMARRSDD
ncbi:hypothetical protein MIND_00221800 [Mycena indigotica]|uniref:F-box domain-containing protein n=1 Tax=Mycena indigotica TaxID=2126181 RepID=A0A8H6T4T1_9AGAR|nr:uncharacterized protein MIND_00221800 [Mycena indigotica]KAF7312095.1 hypothetical protein MIND_00221800 [Mycena indigotica]